MARLHERTRRQRGGRLLRAGASRSGRPHRQDLCEAAEGGRILERLQAAQPDHPGIVHYIIHSYDYAPIAAKGLARRAPLCVAGARRAARAAHALAHLLDARHVARRDSGRIWRPTRANRAYTRAHQSSARPRTSRQSRPLPPARLPDQRLLAARAGPCAPRPSRRAQFDRGLPADASITAPHGFAAIASPLRDRAGRLGRGGARCRRSPPATSRRKPSSGSDARSALRARRKVARANQDMIELSRLQGELARGRRSLLGRAGRHPGKRRPRRGSRWADAEIRAGNRADASGGRS